MILHVPFHCFSQNQSFSSQVEEFRRKIVELGWESFVDSLKIRRMVGRIMMVIGKVGLMIRSINGMMAVACMV